MNRAVTAIILSMTACILYLQVVFPYLSGGYPVGHSYFYNIPWLVHFIDQFQGGDLYPRWLWDYHLGVGAPVFYFYAPVPFFLGALIGAICPQCSVQTLAVSLNLILLFGSGVGFYFWARTLSGRLVSVLGAAWYVILPYHFFDSEVRNALGETAAYAIMPLILLGMRGLGSSQRAVAGAGLAYGLLIMTHLPTAVLFSGAMLVFAATRTAMSRNLAVPVHLVAVVVIGVAVAAIYLAPALALRVHLAPDGWIEASGQHYFPERWLIFSDTVLSEREGNVLRTVLLTQAFPSAVALLALGAVAAHWRRGRRAGAVIPAGNREILIAASLTLLLGWALMTQPAQWLWVNVPVLRQVQFPWRIGTVLDLSGATILVLCCGYLADLPRRSRAAATGIGGPALVGLGVLVVISATLLVNQRTALVSRTTLHDRGLQAELADLLDASDMTPGSAAAALKQRYPIEYRSVWVLGSDLYAAPGSGGFQRWSDEVTARPAAWVADDPAGAVGLQVRRRSPAALDLAIDTGRAATIRVRQVYFPGWTLADTATGAEVPVLPSAHDGMIRFDVPAGKHRLSLRVRALPVERIGAAVSGGTLLLLGLAFLLGRLSRVRGARLGPVRG